MLCRYDRERFDPVRLALAEAIQMDGDIVISVGELSFVDLSCARSRLVVRLGAGGVTGIGRVTVHDR